MTNLERDLGADYIDMFEVIMTIEEYFGIYLEPGSERTCHTIQDIVSEVQRTLDSNPRGLISIRGELGTGESAKGGVG
jgi:hypothetical protein